MLIYWLCSLKNVKYIFLVTKCLNNLTLASMMFFIIIHAFYRFVELRMFFFFGYGASNASVNYGSNCMAITSNEILDFRNLMIDLK